MFQADATIAWIDRNGMAQAQDYYLSNYVQVCFNTQIVYRYTTQCIEDFCVHNIIVSWW